MTNIHTVRTIVIFGATSAIAQDVAKLYALERAEFFLVARHSERLAIVAKDLEVRGAARVETCTADLGDLATHDAIIEKIAHVFPRLDLVFVAHGHMGDAKAGEADASVAEEILRVNLISVVSLLTPLANRLEHQRQGTIAVIGSVAGDRGRQSNYLYGAAKSGLAAYLQGLRNRLFACGVHVLTIKPGYVDTPLVAHIPKNALFATPERVARDIKHAIEKRRDILYTPWFWRFIMLIVKTVPECVFKRLKV